VPEGGNPPRRGLREICEAYWRDYRDGYEKGKVDHAIWYYCAVCGGKIYVKPGSNSHMVIIRYMKEHRWGHTICYEKE